MITHPPTQPPTPPFCPNQKADLAFVETEEAGVQGVGRVVEERRDEDAHRHHRLVVGARSEGQGGRREGCHVGDYRRNKLKPSLLPE